MAYHTEKTASGTDIVIDGWENGISPDPYTGLADMRNIENVSIPGEASVALSTQTTITQAPITNVTFTANASTDTLTYNGTIPLEVNTVITVSNSGGGLPGGMAANTAYYVKSIPTSTTFTLSQISAGGTLLNITTNGTGTQSFSTIQMGTPSYFSNSTYNMSFGDVGTKDINFVLDSNGRVWVYDNSNLGGSNKWVYCHNQQQEATIFLETGNGLVIYKDYLFWFSSNYVSVLSLIDYSTGLVTLAHLTTLSSWFSDWKQTLTNTVSTISHYAIASVNDNSVYFCNGKYVGSLLTAISINGTPTERSDGQIFNIANTHTVANGATHSSTNLTSVSAFFQSTDVGAVIVGTNIPTGAYITAVASPTSATISAAATGTTSGLTFTITSGYVYNAQALELPQNDLATCLTELGIYLLVGGILNYIYPWDRFSISFDNAIFLSENYTSRMVTINTTTYIFCGYRGRIYVTNGSNVSFYAELPDYLSGGPNTYMSWTDAVFNRNQLYFGFRVTTNSGTIIKSYGGLWTLNPEAAQSTGTKGAIKLQNILSYGTYDGYASAIGINNGTDALNTPSNDGYGLFIGWNDGTVGGIDKGVSSPYTASQAYVVSDMIPVGNFYDKRNYTNIQYKLSAPLVSGESVSLYWREKINDSFVLLGTTTTVGAFSDTFSPTFSNLQWLQLKAVLNSTASNPSFVRLQQLRIH